MVDNYPGKTTEDSGDHVLSTEWFDTAPTNEFHKVLRMKWEQHGTDGKTDVLRGVSSYIFDKVHTSNLTPADAETFVDLSLRNVLSLLEEADPETYEVLRSSEMLGQIMANLGGLFSGDVFSKHSEAIGYATPAEKGKDVSVKIIEDIQGSANSHEGMLNDELSQFILRTHISQLVNASMTITREMINRAENGQNTAFNSRSSYILGNLGGLVAQTRNLMPADS